MATIAIIAFDGFTDIDLFLHWDLLGRAGEFGAAPWQVVLLGTAPHHTSHAGLPVPMHGTIDDARTASAVLHTSGPATRQLMRDAAYLRRLALDPTRQLVASQCSGALVLAASGVLAGKPATTYPTARDDLASFGVTVVDEPFVAHERVATAAGCLAGVELSRWLIAKLASPAIADVVVQSAAPVTGTR